MKMKLVSGLTLVLAAGCCLDSCSALCQEKNVPLPVTDVIVPAPVKTGGVVSGVVGPRWLRGITVKNESGHDLWVMVGQESTVSQGGMVIEGGKYELLPAGAEKLIASQETTPKGLTWYTPGEAKVYETAKFGKPDYVVIKKDNRYDMTSMDALKDMGTWTANAPVESKNILAEPRNLRDGEGCGAWWGVQGEASLAQVARPRLKK